MFEHQRKGIEKVLDDYKAGIVDKKLAIQGIQNCIGEFKELAQNKGYAITDYEVEEKDESKN